MIIFVQISSKSNEFSHEYDYFCLNVSRKGKIKD